MPPPAGGIATWTKTVYSKGYGDEFNITVLDSKVQRNHYSDYPKINLSEITRTLNIVIKTFWNLLKNNFSIVHINSSISSRGIYRDLVVALICKLFNVPYVVHFHGTLSNSKSSRFTDALFMMVCRRLIKWAGATLVLNRQSYEFATFLDCLVTKIHNVPNFIDMDEFKNVSNGELRSLNSKKRIIFVGNISKLIDRGRSVFLDVAELVTNCKFVVVGTSDKGSLVDFLKLIETRNLKDKVEVLGELEHHEVIMRLFESDIFFFPSRQEGFPLSVIEAMAAKLPVLTTHVGAIAEMIDVPEGGTILDPDDANGFAQTLNEWMLDPFHIQNMGDHNYNKCEKQYEYVVVAKNICNIYLDVLDKRKS